MKSYPIIPLPDDLDYRWRRLFDDTIVLQYGEALDCFLLLGEDRALLIDTAYGRGDFPNLIGRLSGGREVIVVNTHGHYDHTGGNPWFPRVHMHPNAMRIADVPFSPPDPAWAANLPYPDYEKIPVGDGACFELGGRTVEVLYTPAHTDGSLSFIDHKRRLLFSGDEFDAGQANLFGEDTVLAFLNNCRRLKAREAEFDWIMPNHNGCPIAKSYLDDFIVAAQHVVDGHPDFVPKEDLPGYKQGFGLCVRVQVGDSCINYRTRALEALQPPGIW